MTPTPENEAGQHKCNVSPLFASALVSLAAVLCLVTQHSFPLRDETERLRGRLADAVTLLGPVVRRWINANGF